MLFSQLSSPVETYIENWLSLNVSLSSTTGCFKPPQELPVAPNLTHSTVKENSYDPHVFLRETIVTKNYPYKVSIDAIKSRPEVDEIDI